MLENIKKSQNILIPFTPHNNSIQVQAGAYMAWSGWVLLWKSTTEKDSILKERYKKFHLSPSITD